MVQDHLAQEQLVLDHKSRLKQTNKQTNKQKHEVERTSIVSNVQSINGAIVLIRNKLPVFT